MLQSLDRAYNCVNFHKHPGYTEKRGRRHFGSVCESLLHWGRAFRMAFTSSATAVNANSNCSWRQKERKWKKLSQVLEKHQHFTLSTNTCQWCSLWNKGKMDLKRITKKAVRRRCNKLLESTYKLCVYSLCRCVYLKLQRMCSVQTMTQNLSLPWGAPCEDRSLSEERPSKLTFETKASHCRPWNKPS